jgi:class 3 adenylate cyclase/tetratricopeptide (TPR) repeat protein
MRFCGQCGQSLPTPCRACGEANDPSQRFCGQCGANLESTARPDQAPARVAHVGIGRPRPITERRHVSVLFADLVGFTSLSSERDAEDVRELLTRYFETARTVIGRYGGAIEKFIGDAVMAVWGVPLAEENDAERAVRAALELVDAVSAMGESVGAPALQARAGVLSGEAVVNLGATGQGMVAGDLVNTAARVQTAAEPGRVFVGDSTRRATGALIQYEDTGLHELKGKPEPMRLWRATRVVGGRRSALRSGGLEPPFVGRERDLRLLKEFIHATSEEGSSRLLSIIGVGGVGKSRLAWEFEKYVDGLTERVWWNRGRCLSYGDGITYSALSEMVRMRAGILENEGADSARIKLDTCVQAVVPDSEERKWVRPRLAHLLGLEAVESSEPRELYGAWRVFFERLASAGTSVLLFEDLHWADPGLLDFIDYLLDWSRNSPIMIVTLSRPELAERRPDWGVTGRRGFTSLYVEPLAKIPMSRLLDGMVPGLPADLTARIQERAAGIPLYAVETVRMLLDQGLVVQEGGSYRAAGSLKSLEVPETLHALIAARLDRLSEPEHQILLDAAVLGASFSTAAIAAVGGSTSVVVEPLLHSLVRKDLLAMESDSRSPERGQFVFVQDLVRGVAYGTLARRERKSRHLGAAAYLTELPGHDGEVAEIIASHLDEAYKADPNGSDATEIRARAQHALVQAADHASSLGGPESACRYYERALELAGDEGRADLHLKAARAAKLLGQFGRVAEHSASAIELYRASGDAVGSAEALHDLGLSELIQGRADISRRRFDEALALLSTVRADDAVVAAMAKIEVRLARSEFFFGHLESGLAHVERSLDMVAGTELWYTRAWGLCAKGEILAALGQRVEAETLIRAAVNVAIDHDLINAAALHLSLGTRLEEDDRITDSLEAYAQATALFIRLGDRPHAASAALNGIAGLFELGRWDEAQAIITQYIEVDAPEVGFDWDLGPLIEGAAWIYRARGDIAAARQVIDEYVVIPEGGRTDLIHLHACARAVVSNAEGNSQDGFGLAESALRAAIVRDPVTARLALIEAVEAAFALSDSSKAMKLIAYFREHVHSGQQPSSDAHILRWMARLAVDRNDDDEARAQFSSAIDAFLILKRPYWVAVTRLEMAELQVSHGDARDSEQLLAQARQTFTALRATPWIERVDVMSARLATPAPDRRSASGRRSCL